VSIVLHEMLVWGTTCHMKSQSVTCHLTHSTLTSARELSIQFTYPWRDGRKSWPRWLVTNWDVLL